MNKIKELRKQDKITQAKLAKIIGVSRSAISMYEIGASEPDFVTISKFADYFNVSVDYLLGRSDSHDSKEQKKPPAKAEGYNFYIPLESQKDYQVMFESMTLEQQA